LKGSPARSEPVGRWLARERRLRGLSLEEVSATTRIPRRSLERLEAGAFDGSPDGFTRGFVRAVADAIGLDPSEALARLLGEAVPERRARRHLAPGGVVAVVGVALALGVLTCSLFAFWPERTPAPAIAEAPAPPELRRRDFVRELASERVSGHPAPVPAP